MSYYMDLVGTAPPSAPMSSPVGAEEKLSVFAGLHTGGGRRGQILEIWDGGFTKNEAVSFFEEPAASSFRNSAPPAPTGRICCLPFPPLQNQSKH